ncbi:DNA-binding domain, excisionase family protein [Spirochaetia bacterium]|nr:DNA-binding domain, excisionase family protein [Spirochaetia bacterium]
MESTLLTADDVAQQLRIKKYTVYELIKRGELPSSKVGKQVRFSQEDIRRYLEANKTGPLSRKSAADAPLYMDESRQPEIPLPQAVLAQAASAAVIISGQDRCLDLLVSRIAEAGAVPLRSYVGCYNGLYALYHGRVTMAASHLWDGETDTYNYPFIRRLLPGLPVGVLRLAGRMQGFYVKKGNPLNIKDWKDLARPDVAMVNRERGCGTRILLDQKLRRAGLKPQDIRGYGRESTSHMACAATVSRGGADAGIGCERGAENAAGVDFIPLQLEWYDFVFRLSDQDTAAVRSLTSYVSSAEFKQDLQMMGGYDLSQTGVYEEL